MARQAVVETIELFFEAAAARGGRDPMLRHASGSCRFDVVGVGSWLMRADHGALTFDKAEHTTPADSTVTASEDDFLRMAHGEQNPRTAFMQGRVKLAGNLALADRFLYLFP
jgi:predicted lipid carrier protein YhbT